MDSLVCLLLFLSLVMHAVLVPVEESQGGYVKGEHVAANRRRPRKTPEDAIRRQIKRVREKILSQLSDSVRTESPTGNVGSQLPQSLLHMYNMDVAGHATVPSITDDTRRSGTDFQAAPDADYESKYKRTKVTVFGHKERRKHGWSYRFHIQMAGAHVKITSAFLWLHKHRDVSCSGASRLTLNVNSAYDDDDDASSLRSRRYQLSWTSGWFQLDITELVRRPVTTLTVRCVGGSAECRRVMRARSKQRRPFVVISTSARRQPQRRSRRHLEHCPGGDCCTLYPYDVSFSQLGFDFIIRPRVFRVNYCYGSCTTSEQWNVTNMNKTFYRTVLDLASQVYNDRRLDGCCVPSATSSISVVHLDRNGEHINDIVPGIRVEDCECV